MDWNSAIEDNRRMLKRIVALLFALAGLAERLIGLPRPVRACVLLILRPAEAVARDFVLKTQDHGGSVPLPAFLDARHGGDSPADAMRLARSFRLLAVLLDRQAEGNCGRGKHCITPGTMIARLLAGLSLEPSAAFPRHRASRRRAPRQFLEPKRFKIGWICSRPASGFQPVAIVPCRLARIVPASRQAKPSGAEARLALLGFVVSVSLRLFTTIALIFLLSSAGGALIGYYDARQRIDTELEAAIVVGKASADRSVAALANSFRPADHLMEFVSLFDGDRHLQAKLVDPDGRLIKELTLLAPENPVPGWFLELLRPEPRTMQFRLPGKFVWIRDAGAGNGRPQRDRRDMVGRVARLPDVAAVHGIGVVAGHACGLACTAAGSAAARRVRPDRHATATQANWRRSVRRNSASFMPGSTPWPGA